MAPLNSYIAATPAPAGYAPFRILSAGVNINGGYLTISATTSNLICTAMVVDAASIPPQGISLHLVRYNPATGTEE